MGILIEHRAFDVHSMNVSRKLVDEIVVLYILHRRHYHDKTKNLKNRIKPSLVSILIILVEFMHGSSTNRILSSLTEDLN